MFEYFESEKAKKKAMTAEEKKAAKKAKEDMEANYTHCLLDGRKEKVGNFRVEPPGLFRGRGEHPRKGALKVNLFGAFHEILTKRSLATSETRRYYTQHWERCSYSGSERPRKMEGDSA
jgi:hypothetical protein